VEEDISVAVAAKPCFTRYLHAPQNEPTPLLKSVYIIADAYPHV
jgi:hypothetical protein